MQVDTAFAAVRNELDRAMARYGPLASPHEAYAVILEELDEVWFEVKAAPGIDYGRLRGELAQVAAMAIRALVDLDAVGDQITWH